MVADQTSKKPWRVEMRELVARAAELSVENAVELEAFVRAAYSAYLDARPGLREWIEEQELRTELDEARLNGRMAEA